MVEIKGLQKLSLIDYPDKISAVIFLGGCNFRCPFCQNPDLVLNPEKLQTISLDEIISFLKSRRDWLDGVCITGGEPTIYKDLPDFIKQIKSLGLLVKLDTNGSNPEMLDRLVKDKIIDYIAMDIKGPLEKYDKIIGTKVNKELIQKSIDVVRSSGLQYEFRTTILPALHTEQDVLDIGKWLSGSEKFVIQQFRRGKTVDIRFGNENQYSQSDLERMQNLLKPYFKSIEIRN